LIKARHETAKKALEAIPTPFLCPTLAGSLPNKKKVTPQMT
jgi:hypothetical protein